MQTPRDAAAAWGGGGRRQAPGGGRGRGRGARARGACYPLPAGPAPGLRPPARPSRHPPPATVLYPTESRGVLGSQETRRRSEKVLINFARTPLFENGLEGYKIGAWARRPRAGGVRLPSRPRPPAALGGPGGPRPAAPSPPPRTRRARGRPASRARECDGTFPY